MKRILLLAMLVVFGVTTSNAQTKTKAKCGNCLIQTITIIANCNLVK